MIPVTKRCRSPRAGRPGRRRGSALVAAPDGGWRVGGDAFPV